MNGSDREPAGAGKRAGTALITGGTRRIGGAIARALAAAGYDLVLQTRDPATVDPGFLADLGAAGAAVDLVTLDLGDAAALAARIDDLFARRPDIGLVVNNASRFEPDDFASLTPGSFNRHMAVNALAPLMLIQALDRARGADGGAVVNVLDAKLAWPHPDFLSYTLGKATLATITDLAARHYAPRIRVNGVAPGLTLISPFQDEARFAAEKGKLPLGPGLGPGDIADAVVFLAGAAQVTGQVIAVDGGERYLARQHDPSTPLA
ncbi:SDR family oxidoreductase [Zavarzinia compransoris]|uniref:SDR family oxidoreductase n=1 Tax=Zavarzinia marina TaxID=2911065 RepID=UPI001F2DB09E|nr:SDR family oxidoreductase [Zavarzinia marina]MCF4165732.1 SDR family oxidoreductase [Zavarzinia marina]